MLVVRCKKHPIYTGNTEPEGGNGECPACWDLFVIKDNLSEYLASGHGLQILEIEKESI